jgi:outer membrane protein TolC
MSQLIGNHPILSELHKNVRLLLFSISLLGSSLESLAQETRIGATKTTLTEQLLKDRDSSKAMNLEEFYERILAYHPVAKQAALLSEEAKQELRMARGNFDPKIEAVWDRKEFGNTEYYNTLDNVLKLPVWIGELKGGYEYNRGTYLNPENKTPSTGLGYAGISVPLGQGLIIDARRATLRQAQYFQQIAEADRVKEINKLLLNAAKEYWNWYVAYNEFRLMEDAVNLAQIRFNASKERVINGDLAPIDSVEAKTLLQERSIQYQQAIINQQNAQLLVSNYLWGDDNTPLELEEDIIPAGFNWPLQAITEETLASLMAYAQTQHPELVKLDFKLKQLNVEERLQRDRLKPVLNLNYNFLTATPLAMDDMNMALLRNNYKFGAQFAFPLFLRKERAKVGLTRIKQSQTSFERLQVNRELINALQASYNSLKNLESLILLQQDMITNYEQLRNGEVQKFEAGESSIFLINSRETKLIDAQVKLIDLHGKYEKEKATLIWAAGRSTLD